jgi:hypothetical protein
VIPPLEDVGGPWKVLPPGIHEASLEEIELHYATNEYRKKLFAGFVRAHQILRASGSTNIYLNGGFVGDNPKPSDFDCCWDSNGVDISKLDPVFLDFSNKRFAQKEKYSGEFFPATSEAAPGQFFLSYFQRDKHSGNPKGIIRVHDK